MHLADERSRIAKLIKYGAFCCDLSKDSWIELLLGDSLTAFKARVWLMIVNRLNNVPYEDEDQIDLASYFPRMENLLCRLESDVIGAYVALANSDDIKLIARTISFGIYVSALAHEMGDTDIPEKLYNCKNPYEYTVIMDVYLKRRNLWGVPSIIMKHIEKIDGVCFCDFKERAYVFSQSIVKGKEALDRAEEFIAVRERQRFPLSSPTKDDVPEIGT